MKGDSPRSVEQSAARWVAKASLGALTDADRLALDSWLDHDPSHRAAFDRLGGALASVDEMGGFMRQAHERLRGKARRRRRQLAMTAVAALGAFIAVPMLDLPSSFADVRTGRGEVRALTLADGSRLWLDADTAVDIDLGPDERRITLLRGRIHARVAHRQALFLVIAGGSEVHDIGTAFDVEQLSDGARTIVSEGKVEVRSGDARLPLAAGQGASWQDGEAPVRSQAADAGWDMGWREGRLRFEDRPLGEVISTLSRYSGKRLFLLNDEMAARRVSGVVRIDQADQDLVSLAESQGLVTTEMGPVILLR